MEAQIYSHHQLTTEDGLPTNYVYGVIEDKEGYIWVYTENGISKFDGYEFKNYSIEDGLPVNDIFTMRKDKEDRLWMFGIENSAGYINNDSIYSIDLNAESRATMRCLGNEISYRCTNWVWVAKNKELRKQKISDEHYKLYLNVSAPIVVELKSIKESFSFDFGKGTLREYFDGKLKSETNYSSTNPQYASFSRIYYKEDENPYYLVFGKNGMLLIDANTKKPSYTPWDSIFQNNITRWNVSYEDNEVFVSTNSGLVVISQNRNIKTYDFPILGEEYSLRRSYKDSNNNVWVGTQQGGLFFFSAEQLQANILYADQANDNLFKHLVKTSEGKTFAVTSKGTIYDVDKGKVFKKVFSKSSIYDAHLTADDQLILTSSNEPLKVFCLKEINCAKKGIDPKLLNFSPKPPLDTRPLNQMVNIKGIIVKNQKDLVVNNSMDLLNISSVGDSIVYKKIENRHRLIYQSPLSKKIYTADKENLYELQKSNELKKIISLPLISCIYQHDNSSLLIGTESSGLYEYFFDNNQINKIGDYGSITQIYFQHNIIYASSNKGIFKFEKNDQNFELSKHWGINQGLPSLEVFDFLLEENKLIACTNNGIAKINLVTGTELQQDRLSKLSVNQVKINGLKLEQGMKVKHSQNDLSVGFKLLDIKSFGEINYKYKLHPIQKNWQTTKDTEVFFNNLAPNKYSFMLEASNNDNKIYKLKNDFSFEIQKPFWRTLPFYFTLLFLTIFSYFIFDKLREQKLKKDVLKENEQNKRIADLKLEALRSQMNPHFVFNALGAIQYYIQTHKIDEADNYLTLFANLMRKYLDSSSEQLISLSDEVSLLNDYISLEKMRFENMFESEILIEPSMDVHSIMIPSMMIQPYIENAINHGLPHRKDGNALLQISINTDHNDDIKIQIRDNGIGRENAKKNKKKFHKSKAMQNTADRIKSLNDAELVSLDINITNNSNDIEFPGTLVVINLKKQTQWNTPQLL